MINFKGRLFAGRLFIGRLLHGQSAEPAVVVAITGVVGYGTVGGVNVWRTIINTQNPGWSLVQSTQTSSWANVNTAQTPNWEPISV